MKSLFVSIYSILLLLLLSNCDSASQKIQRSKAFEIRYVSYDTAANGRTDFKGPTAVFNTEERLDYLRNFADYGANFFDDPDLNSKVVRAGEVDSALSTLKPQPKPEVRQQIDLNEWKYLGYKEGQREKELQQITEWRQMEGVTIDNGTLLLSEHTISKSFAPKKWRMKFSWQVKPLKEQQNIAFNFSGGAVVGFNEVGNLYYESQGKRVAAESYDADQFYTLKVEIDLESGKYNFYLDDKLVANFVPLARPTDVINNFSISTDRQVSIDNIWAVGYKKGGGESKTEIRTHPYYIDTFIDQHFSARPAAVGFEKMGYDDSRWATVPYRRYAHGGERNRGENLYLRKIVKVGAFEQARLHIESVRPSGKLYINGTFVKELGRAPVTIKVNKWLKPNQDNLVAVQVDSYAVDKVRHHMSTDRWSSMFAGLMKLELTGDTYVDEVHAFATDIDDSAASVQLSVSATSDQQDGFSGMLEADFYPWYPEENQTSAAHISRQIQITRGKTTVIKGKIAVADPALWTSESPNLYKVHVKLKDGDGEVVDDFVTITGIRTISQEGGMFRINGKPDVLYGPLVFNQPYPLENVSQQMFSPPKSRWMEAILQTKKMNGNAIRMSVHDKSIAGINDKRLARMGDQMGIMFMWQTPTWIREGETEAFDFKNLPAYMREVYNHPSIVMWQVGNHPTYSMEWYDKVYDTQVTVDSSRLISPAARINPGFMSGTFKNPQSSPDLPYDSDSTYPSWTAPMVGRGNMEVTTSYGKDWQVIRKFPDNKMDNIPGRIRKSYLHSKRHAFFDFESEETIGMPNWNLNKGKPYHKLYSYEKDYSNGNIGRVLKFSEWRESQAWQALSGYEAWRKKRWLDYDGLNWCNLRGGPNTATYMKPLIGYGGHAKLGYYAQRMVYQRTLAGSKNVDIVYGPDDAIPITVMHLGEAQRVTVHVTAKRMDGKLAAQKEFKNVRLKEGRTVTDLGDWKPELEPGTYYAFEYVIEGI